MIINYSGVPAQNIIEFRNVTLPYGNYSFSLINFQGFLISPPKFTDLYEITSNLISREDGNPHRIIGYIMLEGQSPVLTYQPTHKLAYKLQHLDLFSSELIFRGIVSDTILKFSHVAVQLEVKDTYGRL